MKKLYVSAWVFLTAAALVSALTNTMNAAALLVFSLLALGLVYTLLLWSVFTNAGEYETR